MQNIQEQWLLCPVCNHKMRIKLRKDTVIEKLPELRREVLLLYYFVDYHDKAIGRLYGRCRRARSGRHSIVALHRTHQTPVYV